MPRWLRSLCGSDYGFSRPSRRVVYYHSSVDDGYVDDGPGGRVVTSKSQVCAACGKFRSPGWSSRHPLRYGETPKAGLCKKCADKSTSSAEPDPRRCRRHNRRHCPKCTDSSYTGEALRRALRRRRSSSLAYVKPSRRRSRVRTSDGINVVVQNNACGSKPRVRTLGSSSESIHVIRRYSVDRSPRRRTSSIEADFIDRHYLPRRRSLKRVLARSHSRSSVHFEDLDSRRVRRHSSGYSRDSYYRHPVDRVSSRRPSLRRRRAIFLDGPGDYGRSRSTQAWLEANELDIAGQRADRSSRAEENEVHSEKQAKASPKGDEDHEGKGSGQRGHRPPSVEDEDAVSVAETPTLQEQAVERTNKEALGTPRKNYRDASSQTSILSDFDEDSRGRQMKRDTSKTRTHPLRHSGGQPRVSRHVSFGDSSEENTTHRNSSTSKPQKYRSSTDKDDVEEITGILGHKKLRDSIDLTKTKASKDIDHGYEVDSQCPSPPQVTYTKFRPPNPPKRNDNAPIHRKEYASKAKTSKSDAELWEGIPRHVNLNAGPPLTSKEAHKTDNADNKMWEEIARRADLEDGLTQSEWAPYSRQDRRDQVKTAPAAPLNADDLATRLSRTNISPPKASDIGFACDHRDNYYPYDNEWDFPRTLEQKSSTWPAKSGKTTTETTTPKEIAGKGGQQKQYSSTTLSATRPQPTTIKARVLSDAHLHPNKNTTHVFPDAYPHSNNVATHVFPGTRPYSNNVTAHAAPPRTPSRKRARTGYDDVGDGAGNEHDSYTLKKPSFPTTTTINCYDYDYDYNYNHNYSNNMMIPRGTNMYHNHNYNSMPQTHHQLSSSFSAYNPSSTTTPATSTGMGNTVGTKTAAEIAQEQQDAFDIASGLQHLAEMGIKVEIERGPGGLMTGFREV